MTGRAAEQTAHLRHSRNLLIIIALLLSVAAVYFARDLLVPIVFAFLIAITFRPAVRRLAKRGIAPWVSAGAIIGSLVLTVAAASYLFSGPIAQWIATAPTLKDELIVKLRGMRQALAGILNLAHEIQSAAAAASPPGADAQAAVVNGPDLTVILSSVVGYPANFLIIVGAALVLATFLMASGDLFFEKLIHALPALSDKKMALRIVYDVEHEVSAYLFTITAINACVGLAVGIAFYWLGMPTPELWALAAFMLNYIPYLGPILATSLSTLVAIVVFPSVGTALLPPLAYILVTGIESQLVSPLLLGRRLQLNSVAILLALAFWTWAWGIPGIIVAVPLLVTLRVLCGHIATLNVLGDFLAGANHTVENGNGSETEPAAVEKKTTAT
jgi:predicted PurR-regulated permease PerM